MLTLSQMYPAIKTGSVITAVDLIRGIGRYAGLRPIDVEGPQVWPTPIMKTNAVPRLSHCAAMTLCFCT